MGCFMCIDKLSKSFGSTSVIRNLDLSLERGKILAILGPSGCGKSTLLRIIGGLLKQDSGTIMIEGQNLAGVPVNKRQIGFVFQNYSLFSHLAVGKNIEFGPRISGMKRDVREDKVKKLLSLVGLEGYEDRRPGQLSGGQQQRVALARALAVEPRLLLLDEPFGALDAKIRRRIRRDLKDLQQKLGVTMVFVTHDQEEAFEVGDEIAVMNGGIINQVGLPRDLYDRPATGFVASFVGNTNIISLCDGGNDDIDVMVRPEDVILEKRTRGGKQKGVSGTLASYIFLGPCIECRVRLSNGEPLLALMTKSEFLRKGLRRGDDLKVKITRFKSFSK